MRKKIVLSLMVFVLSLFYAFEINAQVNAEETPELPGVAFNESLDSLLNLWYVQSTNETELVPDTIIDVADQTFPKLPDSVYIERLNNLFSAIPLAFNSHVRSYIELYTIRKRHQVQTMLGLSEYYFPIFEEVLDAKGLPMELKYLPIIESALNPRALSRAGASGLWQFMYYTGKRYGLSVDSYLDERRDPVKASVAAASFLSDLYGIYKDWLLVIAAYNCGPGNVNKAISRAGGQRDFWKIFYYLPRETRGYVPAFIAANYAMNYAAEHQLYASPSSLPVMADTVMINRPIHFEQIASMLNVSMDCLRDMNPQYKRDVVPAQKKPFALRLPVDQSLSFVTLEDTLYQLNRSKYFPNDRLVVGPEMPTAGKYSAPANSTRIVYTVKSGDVPGAIAQKFNVRLSDLKYWNNLHKSMIRVNQKLVVYVPKDRASQYQGIASVEQSDSKAASTTEGEYLVHVVQKGDTLWDIAKQYAGVSNNDLVQLNNLQGSKIAVGQKLKIKKI
ncbi:MAG: LysM peptidoglycan-binding domain-containing protein [Breznakibacter sp.]